jgi:hypothetical protein
MAFKHRFIKIARNQRNRNSICPHADLSEGTSWTKPFLKCRDGTVSSRGHRLLKRKQSAKIRELAFALASVGVVGLDQKAAVLGLRRSTAWSLLKAKYKGSGLSAGLIKRMLARRTFRPAPEPFCWITSPRKVGVPMGTAFVGCGCFDNTFWNCFGQLRRWRRILTTASHKDLRPGILANPYLMARRMRESESSLMAVVSKKKAERADLENETEPSNTEQPTALCEVTGLASARGISSARKFSLSSRAFSVARPQGAVLKVGLAGLQVAAA